MEEQKPPCRKKSYDKVGFDLTILIIDQIQNGRISINYASKKYNRINLFQLILNKSIIPHN
jgi:predicted HTH domain antitoxin